MRFERKSFPFALKADSEGSFRAVFSSFDVVDSDEDVTLAGAFKADQPVIVGSWGHKTYDLPVGKGVIQSDRKEAWVSGAFFLDTTPGKDTYETVKALGDLGEWSYVYRPTKVSFGDFQGRQVRFLEEIEVYSVDPVLKGAGVNTRTTDIKGIKGELPLVAQSAELAELLAEFSASLKSQAAEAKEGRMLSGANVERLGGIAESLKSAVGDLETLLAAAEPKQTSELAQEFLRFSRIRAGLGAA